ALVEIGEKWGFIDKTGKQAIQPRFDYALDFCEGLARVSVDEEYGFIDVDGNYVLKPQFTAAGSFSGGLAPVCINDRSGYIDKSGKFVIIMDKKDNLMNFSDGYALVMKPDSTWGYFDKTGKWIWQPTK